MKSAVAFQAHTAQKRKYFNYWLTGAKLAGWNKAEPPGWPNSVATGCRLVIGLVLAMMPPDGEADASVGVAAREASEFCGWANGCEITSRS